MCYAAHDRVSYVDFVCVSEYLSDISAQHEHKDTVSRNTLHSISVRDRHFWTLFVHGSVVVVVECLHLESLTLHRRTSDKAAHHIAGRPPSPERSPCGRACAEISHDQIDSSPTTTPLARPSISGFTTLAFSLAFSLSARTNKLITRTCAVRTRALLARGAHERLTRDI